MIHDDRTISVTEAGHVLVDDKAKPGVPLIVGRHIWKLSEQVEFWKSKASQWISVDERLPEKTQPVLVGFQDRGTAMTATYFYEKGFSIFPSGRVTHWMPIPALPEKKQ